MALEIEMNNDREELDKLSLPKRSDKSIEEKDLIRTYLSEGFDEAPSNSINTPTIKRKVVITLLVGGAIVFLTSGYYSMIASKFLSEGYMQEVARISLIFFIIGLSVFFC